MIYDPSLQWSWSAGEITSPSFPSFAEMKNHFMENKPNQANTICVMVGDRVWAYYDSDFNKAQPSNTLVNKYFYGAGWS